MNVCIKGVSGEFIRLAYGVAAQLAKPVLTLLSYENYCKQTKAALISYVMIDMPHEKYQLQGQS